MTRWLSILAVSAVTLSFAQVATARAQQVIPDRVACRGCEIAVTPVVTLQTDGADAYLSGPPSSVVRDGMGRYWLTRRGGDIPVVFDAAGRVIGSIGRAGGGPGEFRSAFNAMPLPGDSVILFDATLSRATVVGPDLSAGRSISLPIHPGPIAVVSWPDSVVMNSYGGGPAAAARSLHMLQFSGSTARQLYSFGDAGGAHPAGQPAFAIATRVVAAPTTRGFWSAELLRYSISEWTRAGEPLRTLVRTPEWFPGPSSYSIGTPTTPPSPAVDAIRANGDTLWVAVRVPRADWKAAWSGYRSPGRGEVGSRGAPGPTDLYRTVVEVIDTRRGEVVARRWLDGLVVKMLAGDEMVLYDTDRTGTPVVRVVRIRVRR
jgi:hypothetical protein